MALAILLGTGDIDLGISHAISSMDTNQLVGGATAVGRNAVYVAIVLGLLPYLSPKRLFRSGTDPKRPIERIIFAVASRTLLVAIPFMILSHFAKEDLTGETARRIPKLERGHIVSWTDPRKSLFHRIYAEYKTPVAQIERGSGKPLPGKTIWEKLYAKYKTPVDQIERGSGKPLPGKTIWEKIDRSNDTLKDLKEIGQLDFCRHESADGLRGAYIRLRQGPGEYHANRQRQRDLENKTLEKINGLLSKRKFYASFVGLTADVIQTRITIDANVREFRNLIHSARQLEVAFDESRTATDESRKAIVSHNRSILEAWYAGSIRSRDIVFGSIVRDKDQAHRWVWFVSSLGLFVASALLIDLNGSSWHSFYRRQLAHNWIAGRDDKPNSIGMSLRRGLIRMVKFILPRSAKKEKAAWSRTEFPLAELTSAEKGFPYHLISASRHRMPGQSVARVHRQSHFLLSQKYCGSRATNYVKTKDVRLVGPGARALTVSDAMAVSAAAVSPSQQTNPLLSALLFLGNVRLGLWLSNPNRWRNRRGTELRLLSRYLPVSPFRVLAQYRRKPDEASHCFVADGGHYENTGIGELLKRHCRVIIAVDASCDPNHEFSDFAHLIRWARVRHGVVLRQLPGESSLDEQLQQTVPQEAVKHDQRNKTFDDASTSETPERRAFSKRHIVMARIEYGQAQIPDGLLVLVKASLDGDEPFDLLKYAALEPEFPHHATTDQFYQPDRFESYRQLGAHLSQQLVSCLPNGSYCRKLCLIRC